MEEQALESNIQQPIFEYDKLRKDLDYEKPRRNFQTCQNDSSFSIKKIMLKTIPCLGWLAHYKWKQDSLSDFISGFTVAVMHIPQGMAYALLGNVPPITGIYMAFFPVLVYFIFGTSKHNSMGTFAVVCLLTGQAVLEHSDPRFFDKRDLLEKSNITLVIKEGAIGYMPVEVATAITFIVAIFQLLMYALRLGAVRLLLSETLVSGFTTGSAFYVLISQLKDLLGISIPKFKGHFVTWNTMGALVKNIDGVNYAAIIISAVTICVTAFNNEVLKPLIGKKTIIPIPIELIAVVTGTLVSKYFQLSETYSVKIIGEIPKGLPVPEAPPFELLSSLLLEGLTIAIVSYAITLSMALIFAEKENYEIDSNQELLAMGFGNIVGSFFSCMPFCASLSRSLIQRVVGGKTQIASVVSCAIVLVVLLWIGPFFEVLPKSVLASLIIVALKGMLKEVMAFWKFWTLSKLDGTVWLLTFLTVITVSIDIGLLVGIILSLITIFALGLKPYTCLLGCVPQTDLYLDLKRYKGVKQINGVKIFHYSGGLNFATKSIFKEDLIHLVGVNPDKEIAYRIKLNKYLEKKIKDNAMEDKIRKIEKKVHADLQCLILDFSSVSFIDPSAVSAVKNIIRSFEKLDVQVYIASCPDPVYNMIQKCEASTPGRPGVKIFSAIHDAVKYSSNVLQQNYENSITCIRF